MRLVNESDPGAYSRHPYWSNLKYDDSCAGDKLDQYVKNQYYNGERWWMDLGVNTWTVIGVCLTLYALFRGSFSGGAVVGVFVTIIFAYFAATLVLMHTHFEVDITFMAGGILHHARADKPGIDFKSGSVTEGYLYCGLLNRALYTLAIYLLITRDNLLKKYYNPLLAAGFLQLLLLLALTIVGKMHPVYHVMAVNGSTPEMDNAWPYTPAWQAYKHCIVHHDNGLSFSGDLVLDPVFDGFLYGFAYLHNTLFKIQLGSTAHFALSTAADAVMGLLGMVLMYGGLHLGVYFIPSSIAKAKESLGKKVN